jgi:hypothetical protein
MDTDLTFASGFTVEILNEIPNSSVQRIFYPPIETGGKDGILISVSVVDGRNWLGQFAFGDVGSDVTAVIASPQHRHLIVISAGAVYDVCADNPHEWHSVDIVPVRQVLPVHESKTLLLSDFTRIVALGSRGQKWGTKRLCWDDLRIERVEDGLIFGSGYDPTDSNRPQKHFVVTLADGELHSTEFDESLWA